MPKVGNDAQDGAALVTAVGVGSWAVETSAFVNDRSNGDHHVCSTSLLKRTFRPTGK